MRVQMELVATTPDTHTHTPVTVLYLPTAQGGLLNLDLFIQQRQLIIAPYQLSAQDVTLPQHQVKLFLLPHALCGTGQHTATEHVSPLCCKPSLFLKPQV